MFFTRISVARLYRCPRSVRNQKANAFSESLREICASEDFDPNYEFGRMLRTKKGRTAMAIISRSVLTVSRTTTVKDAVELMASAKVGSVIVVDDDRLAGIFSERDVMLRVVLEGRDPKQTTVEEVMTAQVHSISMRTTGD